MAEAGPEQSFRCSSAWIATNRSRRIKACKRAYTLVVSDVIQLPGPEVRTLGGQIGAGPYGIWAVRGAVGSPAPLVDQDSYQ